MKDLNACMFRYIYSKIFHCAKYMLTNIKKEEEEISSIFKTEIDMHIWFLLAIFSIELINKHERAAF